MTPVFLGLDEVLEIHRDQIERYGGSFGVRDMGLLQSALAMPQGAFYVFADASKWTDDSYAFAFELLEKAGVGVPAKRVGRPGWISTRRLTLPCSGGARPPRAAAS